MRCHAGALTLPALRHTARFDAGFSCQETHTSVSGGDVECVDIDECHGPAGNPCGTEVCHNMTGGSPGFKCGGNVRSPVFGRIIASVMTASPCVLYQGL